VRPKRLALIAVMAFVGVTCTRAESAERSSAPSVTPPPRLVKIAFLEDLSGQDAPNMVAPAFQGAKLGFDAAGLSGRLPVTVELVALDTGGDSSVAADVATQVVEDAGFVGAIVAPFVAQQLEIGDVLNSAGVPTISLSALAPHAADRGWTAWRRAVATVVDEGRTIAAFVDGRDGAGRGVCLAGDGTMGSRSMIRAVAASLRERVVLRWLVSPSAPGPGGVVTAVSASRCGTIVWGGGPSDGAVLRQWLAEGGLERIAFVGGDAMKAPIYLSVAGGVGRGAVAACPCVDVSTSTSLAAQRFIQDYQADFGLPPGPYAAEAWDVARMFVQAFRVGASSRADVLSALSSRDHFDGLANEYRFLPGGDLAPSAAAIHLFRDQGGRWIPLPAPSIAHSG
jgi:ABC-type branched-subunit amino acid transport system substrate-binding protein